MEVELNFVELQSLCFKNFSAYTVYTAYSSVMNHKYF
jgi:hypothetical protein